MSVGYSPYIWAALLGAFAAAGVTVYAARTGTRTGRLFALVGAAGAVWSLAYALELAGADLASKLWWARVQYLGIAGLPLAWAAFSLHYTGHDKWLTPRWAAFAGTIPLATLLLAFSNDWHGLLWRDAQLLTAGPIRLLALTHGPWFWVHVAYAYTLNATGSGLLVLNMLRAPSLYRRQSAALLLGMALPWLGNLIYISGLGNLPGFDLTPISFAFSAGVIAWGVFRAQLLDLVPVARDTLVEASSDGLLVLDACDRVVDLNPAAQRLLGGTAGSLIGQPAASALALPLDLVGPAAPATPSRAEISLGLGAERRTYDLTVTPLLDPRGRITGRLMALRDISDRLRAEAELRAQKQLFENLVAVARATAEGPTLEATLQNALNVATTLTTAERGSLFVLNAAGEVTHSLLTYSGLTRAERDDLVRRVMSRGLSGWVARQRQALLVADTLADGRWLASDQGYAARSALGVPILSGQVLVGVLTLSHSQPGRFAEPHLTLLQAAADQMALALRNAQVFESQRQTAQRQTALYGVVRALSETLEPAGVAQAAADSIRSLLGRQSGWRTVSIALPGSGQASAGWRLYAANGKPASAELLPTLDGPIGRAFATGSPQYVADHAGAAPEVATPAAQLAIPLRRGTRVLAVLSLESAEPGAFRRDEALLAERLADAVALALDNAFLYQAITDESSRLQALIKSSRDGICLVSSDLRLLVMNAPVLELLGVPGMPDDWLGRPLLAMLSVVRQRSHPAARAILAEIRRVRQGDEPAAEGELSVTGVCVQWLSLPVSTGTGPLGRLVVLHDVTTERSLQKLRDDLTDTLVHDLRNPLANIRMALDLLGQVGSDETTDQQRAVLTIAQDSAQRMLQLVNAILDVSRLEAGQMPLALEPVDLHELAGEVLRLQAPLAAERQIALANHVPPGLPDVPADIELVRRVLQNLVGNALKFTPAGGCVSVRAIERAAAEPGRLVQVTVQDTGPGLAPELRSTLFEKFRTGRHANRGTGLGLAFCKLAVEAHSGRIWVESEPGQGAAFHFALPVEE